MVKDHNILKSSYSPFIWVDLYAKFRVVPIVSKTFFIYIAPINKKNIWECYI